LFQDGEFSVSLVGVSVVGSIVKMAFFSLGSSTSGSGGKFFGVFSESSLLVNKSGFNFN